jgi:hypothetical protein
MCLCCHGDDMKSDNKFNTISKVTCMIICTLRLSNSVLFLVVLKLKLIYDRQSIGQSVLVSGGHLGSATNFSFSLKFPSDNCWFVFCSALFDERTGTVQLLLGLVRAVTLMSKSRRTHGHILLSHLRLLQPGGPGPRIYIPQEQGGPVIPPDTGFPFCHLLRLAGLRWR